MIRHDLASRNIKIPRLRTDINNIRITIHQIFRARAIGPKAPAKTGEYPSDFPQFLKLREVQTENIWRLINTVAAISP